MKALPTVAVTELRRDLADALNRVAYGKERIAIRRHGKCLVAIVPAEEAELLAWLEDRVDLGRAREALAEDPEGVAWEEFRKELGLG